MPHEFSKTARHFSSRREVFYMNLRDWTSIFRALSERQEGQTMAEYGVVLAVITLGVIVALGALALAITGKLGAVTTNLK
jgi:Flp pilus assembly pilin Flp